MRIALGVASGLHVLCLALPAFAADTEQNAPIGVVSFSGVYATREGRAAKAGLKELYDARQTQLDSEQEIHKALKESLERDEPNLSSQDIAARKRAIQKQFDHVQSLYLANNKELEEAGEKATQPLMAKMRTIAGSLAREAGLPIVILKEMPVWTKLTHWIGKQSVLWSAQSGRELLTSNNVLDLTARMIRAFEAGPSAAGSSIPRVSGTSHRIAVVDLPGLVSESQAGRTIKAELRRSSEQKQATLNRAQEDYKKLSGSDAEKQVAFKKLQYMYQQHKNEQKWHEERATAPLRKKLASLIESLAKERGLAVILEKKGAGVIYARPDLDLTPELVRRVNAAETAGTGAPAP